LCQAVGGPAYAASLPSRAKEKAMNEGKFTTVPEVAAYIAAHLAGLAVIYVVNPIIFRALIESGHQASIQAVVLSMSMLVMIAVLLLFLFLRKVLAGAW
jgi:hypothetical protein